MNARPGSRGPAGSAPDGAAGPASDPPDPTLAAWCGNVGAPVVLDLAPPLPAAPAAIDVLCWNLAIGEARLAELLDRLRAEGPDGTGERPERPLVILAQEAYRADETVPEVAVGAAHGGRFRPTRRTDIVQFAREHAMSLRYVPSMRNGLDRSDRGNAVLATCALGPADSISLPLLRQRRVAVAVELGGLPGLAFVSVHLENRTALSHGLRSAVGLGASRAAQAEVLERRILAREGGEVVLGGDLNTPLGARDPAYGHLLRAGFRPATRAGHWRHTYHGPVRLPLDHLFFRTGPGLLRSVTVRRLDEHPDDRGRRVFGSDHHPLLATVLLTP